MGDSLYYGYLAEEGITTGWPGSHPLGHVFFSMIFVIARWAGYTGRGLPLFQRLPICWAASQWPFSSSAG